MSGRDEWESEAARRAAQRASERRARQAGGRPSRPPAPPRRPPPRRRSGGARTMGWLLLFGAVVVLLAVAGLGRLKDRLDQGPASPTTAAEVPVRVTFPEGLRREDMAAIITDKTGLSGEEYLRLTAAGARGKDLAGAKEPRSLEGFLFPATYDVYRATTVADLVDQQVATYRRHTEGIDMRAARKKNLTPYDVLIVASMVEREVRLPAERKVVAGVIYNRLRSNMRLDIDATVQYALGSWKTELTQADLQIDSPYNTRRFRELPPGPINNPGEASIVAAAHPATTPYLFYVARNDGSGGHYFARTDAEFQQAIARSRANAGG